VKEKKKSASKKKNGKKASNGASSLLTRLFGSKKKDSQTKKAAPKVKAKPLTPLQRSITEIQQMTKIGQRDPERLAQLLVTMLGKERAKEEADKQQFDQQVWDILRREEEKGAEGSAPPPSS
jgi:hypothetical protein